MFSARTFHGLVEFSPGFAPRPDISHVLFDFDGTLSLIREGWVDVMMSMFLELLPPLPRETEPATWQMLHDDIMRQNGKQTIYQMIQFAERIKERGREVRDALWYKNEYLRRLDDYQKFSKKMVIERILRKNHIPGEQLLAFGDGYVEIQNTKEVGGLAVAVASDEANNASGKMDEWKRKRLLGVGADVVIPDYRDASALLEIISGR